MRKFSSSTRAKVLAFAAAGLILGVGGTVTLAAWVDNEWVYGGAGDGDEPGVGTSEFIVEQNVSSPFIDDLGSWDNEAFNPGNVLEFTGQPLALTPGDTIYSPVALRTTIDSIDGFVDLQGAVPANGPGTIVPIPVDDAGGLLWDALRLNVAVIELPAGTAPPACDGAFFGEATAVDVVIDGALGAAGITSDSISAESADYLHYCFAVTLPLEEDDPALMGRTVAPAWQFISTSN